MTTEDILQLVTFATINISYIINFSWFESHRDYYTCYICSCNFVKYTIQNKVVASAIRRINQIVTRDIQLLTILIGMQQA